MFFQSNSDHIDHEPLHGRESPAQVRKNGPVITSESTTAKFPQSPVCGFMQWTLSTQAGSRQTKKKGDVYDMEEGIGVPPLRAC